MRSILSLTILACASLGLAGDTPKPAGNGTANSGDIAQPAPPVNSTHYVDPGTNQTYKHFDCDVTNNAASKDLLATLKDLKKQDDKLARRAEHWLFGRSPRNVNTLGASSTITIKTYMHLITKTKSAGSLTTAMANAQLQALNKAYNPNNIFFTNAGIDVTANDKWAVASGSDMDDLKKKLRKGTYADLNLYFHTDLDNGILGTCTLPSQVPAGAQASIYYNDGCNIASGTMPGGGIYGYNAGMTAVHETGHWLGLLHTFEGYSCSGDGDYIADTRQQSTSTDGCPTSPAKNSCPNIAGVDPIHNYMDYSTDACYQSFSAGQVSRIQTLWAQFRKNQ